MVLLQLGFGAVRSKIDIRFVVSHDDQRRGALVDVVHHAGESWGP